MNLCNAFSPEVLAELIKRRFGIFVPEREESIISRGRKIERRVPMCPGYAFVFLWQGFGKLGLLVNTQGVIGILAALSDQELDRVRLRENRERPIVLECFAVEQTVIKKRKKRWRKSVKAVTVPDEIVTTRRWSAFEDAVETLDSEGRNQAMRDLLRAS